MIRTIAAIALGGSLGALARFGLAQWIAAQLHRRYGPAVRVTYFDLFDEDCPPIPAGAELPLVLVNGEILSSGGKLSMPAIRKRLEALGSTVHA